MAVMSEEARRRRIEEALSAHPADEERISLPWQNTAKVFQVVRISLDAIVLNPHSHRIRSQLESHPSRQLVDDSPYSEEAQDILAEILRSLEGFEELKTNLREEGQRDAGVISCAGLLVNANRRAVALRDLGQGYVRVAVLPPDATQQEIDELELRLQMKLELKQEYTFTNELIFVDELSTKYSRSPEQIALDLRWAPSSDTKELAKGKAKVEQAIRLLSMIRQVQEISQKRIPLTVFDEKRQALKEIDDTYQDLKKTDPDAARKVRDARQLGVLLGLGYADLRRVDQGFLSDYYIPAMEASEELAEHVSGLTSAAPSDGGEPSGLEILETPGAAPEDEPDPARMLELLAKSTGESTIEIPRGDTTVTLPRERIVDALRTAMEAATEEARTDQKAEDRLGAPIQHLAEGNRKLRKALDAYRNVAEDEDFKRGKFEYEVKKAGRNVDALKAEIAQHG